MWTLDVDVVSLGSCPRAFLAAALDVCVGCRMLPS
nr:MAG TPA: protein of unknown function (DUF4395) [Caudoviricetes sp.]